MNCLNFFVSKPDSANSINTPANISGCRSGLLYSIMSDFGEKLKQNPEKQQILSRP
jgi:hypothetical protein